MKGMESWILRLHEDLSQSNPGQTDRTERMSDSEQKLQDESLGHLERGGPMVAVLLKTAGGGSLNLTASNEGPFVLYSSKNTDKAERQVTLSSCRI